MNKQVTLKILLVISFLACLYVNYLSNALPLNGFTAGQLSDLYPNQFTPAGFTFAVWGVIYLSAIIAVVSLLIAKEEVASTGWYYRFIVINILNASWLLAWHYQYLVGSIIVMALLLSGLISLYLNVRGTNYTGFAQRAVQVMTSLYLSWIAVAIIANSTAVLVHFDLVPSSVSIEAYIAASMLIVAGGICYWLTTRYSDFIYPLVLAWASYGVYSKAVSLNIAENQSVIYTAIGLIILCAFLFTHNGRKALNTI